MLTILVVYAMIVIGVRRGATRFKRDISLSNPVGWRVIGKKPLDDKDEDYGP